MENDSQRVPNPYQEIYDQLSSQNKLLLQILKIVKEERPNNEDEVGGMELAVRVTGLKQSTIYQLTSKREIPHSRRLKKLYFSRKELTEWINGARRATVFELQDQISSSKKN